MPDGEEKGRTGGDIRQRRRGSVLEESCMVILLCNYHRELWMPLLISQFESLKEIIKTVFSSMFKAKSFHPRKENQKHTYLNYLL